MTRTAIRHALSALAMLASASTGVSANELQSTERELVDSLQTMHRGTTRNAKAKKAQAATHRPIPWMQSFSEGSDLRK